MRVYDFPNVKVYDCLYEGLMVTSTKGAETRAIGRVLKEMETIGFQRDAKKDGKLVLDENGNVVKSLLYTIAECKPVEIQDADHDVVKKQINATEWNGVVAKVAGELMEWLDVIPTKDDYERKKAAAKDGILKLEKKNESTGTPAPA